MKKLETISPWENHQCRLNQRNLGLRCHATYASEHALTNFPYLRHERLMIYNIYLMHNVHENLLQVFVNPVEFTVERMLNFIISQHCCGFGFWSKRWAKRAAKVSEFLSYCTFWSKSWKCFSIIFLRWFLSVYQINWKTICLEFTFG